MINSGTEALNSSLSPDALHPRSEVDTLVFVFFSVLLALAIVIGNSIVMTAFIHNRKLRKRGNVFLVSLACSDCIVGVASLPLWICISGLGISTGEVFEFFISLDIFSALTSVFHLTAISVERFISVSRPFLYQRLSSRVYTATITSAWLLAALIASSTPLQKLFKLQRFYAPSFTSVGFLGPLVIISSMYAGIFRIAISLSRHTPGSDRTCRTSCREKSKLKKEIKVAMTLTVVSGFFFLAWLPFYSLLMIAVYCPQCLPARRDLQRLVEIVKWMHYSNSAVNPFIYAFRDKEMKREFLQLLQFKRLSDMLTLCLSKYRATAQDM